MAPPKRGSTHPITAYYLFIDLEKMKAELAYLAELVADGLPT